jgi:hypothetical protein
MTQMGADSNIRAEDMKGKMTGRWATEIWGAEN